ncbi:MAG TPA: bifunctional precorrin-2 dehydrogenase/sirohydrochlorin ferrochelatase [Candidatus Binatia bacterium]
MQYHPVHLDLRGRPCVVVGGGEEALRKVESLLEAGARVTVVNPTLVPSLAALAETHEVIHHARAYRQGDLAGAALAYAAVDDPALQAALAAAATAAGVFLNVVDVPRLCTFIAPAVVRRGPVLVAVSTGGASPALARRLRQEIECQVGAEYGLAAAILAKVRPLVRAAQPDAATRSRTYAGLVDGPLLAALRARDAESVDAILRAAVGEGTSLASLGVALS